MQASKEYVEKMKSILCVDPDRKMLYLNELDNGHILIIPDPPAVLLDKIDKEIAQIKDLLDCTKLLRFDISKEARILEIYQGANDVPFNYTHPRFDSYRRRKLPVNCLTLDRSDYPTFFSRDDLSLAFLVRNIDTTEESEQVITSVWANIQLEYYSDLLDKQQGKGAGGKRRAKQIASDYNIDVKLNLLASINENIKHIVYESFFKYGIEIQKKAEDKYMALKQSATNQYFYGDMSLINYYYVQDCIRFQTNLELTIVEIPKEGATHPDYPKFFEADSKLTVDVFKKLDIWDTILDLPIMFWPLPRDLNQFKPGDGTLKQYQHYNKKFSLPKKSEYFCKPRAFMYMDSMDFSEVRLQMAKQQKFPTQVSRLYSGENLFVFRYKILSVANLQNLFVESEYDLYYTGSRVAPYISHYPFKTHTKSGAKRIVNYLRLVGRLADSGKMGKNYDYKNSKEFMDLNALDYTSNGSIQLEDIVRFYKLPIKPYLVLLEYMLFAGNRLLGEIKVTDPIPFSNNPRFEFSVKYDSIKICQIPLEARIAFNLVLVDAAGEEYTIGCASLNMFDSDAKLKQGFVEIPFWPVHQIQSNLVGIDPFLAQIPGIPEHQLCKLELQFDTWASEVCYTVWDKSLLTELGVPADNEQLNGGKKFIDNTIPTNEELVTVNHILTRDPFAPAMSDNDKRLIVKARAYLKEIPNTLTYYLYAIKWSDPEQVGTVLANVDTWYEMKGFGQYVLLLDARFHNEFVRAHAVKQLERMSDQELNIYLLFVLIGLCYESEIYNPLTEFIIERSVKNMQFIGFKVFFILRSWLRWKLFRVKFLIILEQIVMLSGSARYKLHDQLKTTEYLKNTAIKMMDQRSTKRTDFIKDQLNPKKKTNELPDILTFPHDFTIQSVGFAFQFSKAVMRKKSSIQFQCTNMKKTLRQFEIMLKYQEEVLQDMFITRMIMLFDKMWMEKGLDLKVTTPKILPVDDLTGYYESFETGVETLKNICEKHGTGMSSLDRGCINKYLEQNNKGAMKDRASEFFRRSAAAYCVATYVLGVVDKNYNYYMVMEDGRFFHHNFGGAIFGAPNREKQYILYTKEMETVVIEKENEEYFYNLCYLALTILRKQAHIIMNLVGMMVVANMPSVQDTDAIDFIRTALNLGGNDSDTCQNFKLLMEASLEQNFRKTEPQPGAKAGELEEEDY